MYKPILLLVICFFAITSAVFAQTTDETALTTRMENLRKALLSADKDVLTNLAADDLSYGHSTGLIEDKATFVEDLVSRKTVFTSVEFSNQTIKVTGDIAIVRNRMLAETNNNNTPAKVDIIVLLIWQKQNGEWKLLARQAARLPVTTKA